MTIIAITLYVAYCVFLSAKLVKLMDMPSQYIMDSIGIASGFVLAVMVWILATVGLAAHIGGYI